MQQIVIRYSEVGLKGNNRNWFENLLMRNIKSHLSSVGNSSISKFHARISLEADANPQQITAILR